jgi:hypothetical protein
MGVMSDTLTNGLVAVRWRRFVYSYITSTAQGLAILYETSTQPIAFPYVYKYRLATQIEDRKSDEETGFLYLTKSLTSHLTIAET